MNSKMFSERGQALIFIALAGIAIVAIVGLAIDGSNKFSDQRHAQNAADTAALAGALAKVQGDSTWKLVAAERAESNGYTNNLMTQTVEVYSCDEGGASCGPYAGNSDYIQVIINSYVDTYFAGVIGVQQTHNKVQAVSKIREGSFLAQGAMIIAYDPNPTCPSGPGNGGGSVDVQGSSTLNLKGGGLLINSSSACGYNAPNCPAITITGGAGINSVAVSPIDNISQKEAPGCMNPPATENFNQDPIIIPDDVHWPDVPTECSTARPNPTPLYTQTMGVDSKLHDDWLIYPGFYSEFPPSSLTGIKAAMYMKSGVYCIDTGGKSLSWSTVDAAILNGSIDPSENKYKVHNPDGVTLYIKGSGGFTFNTKSPTILDASTSGDYQGYLVILNQGSPTSHPSCTINGGAEIDINGLIYAPYCDITVAGGSSSYAEFNAQLIGWDIIITGNNTINFSYDPSNQVELSSQVGLMK